MTSKSQYNNSQWHTVLISRQHSKGRLLIDGEDEVSAESIGNTRVMTLQAPYSFGGVAPNLVDDLVLNSGIDKGKYFQGCIRNIQVGGRLWGEPQKTYGTTPCSDQVEEGVFFNGGYIKVNIHHFMFHCFMIIVKWQIFMIDFYHLQIVARSLQGWNRNHHFV